MHRKKTGKFLSILLTTALLLTIPGEHRTTVYAEETSSESVTASDVTSTGIDNSSGTEISTDKGTGSEGITDDSSSSSSASSNQAADGQTGTEDGMVPEGDSSDNETDKDADKESDEDSDKEKSEEMEEEDITEDKDFSIQVTDLDVNLWQSDKTDDYYLFLPNNVSIPDLTFSVSGISIDTLSSGTYDKTLKLVSGAFTQNEDSLNIKSKGGNTYTIIVEQAADTSSTMITLNGTDLATINSGSKDTQYDGNDVQIIDTDGSILTQSSVQIKGRGNTTWSGNKKPYQIKFNKKQSVLGMEKAKKWVLLANAYDETMIRNNIAFKLSQSLGLAYTPDYKYTNVWVDGDYIGTYMIGEKPEIGDGRLELSNQEGALFELDDIYYTSEDYWFTTDFHTFTVKDSVSDSETDINNSITNFSSKWNALISYIQRTDDNEITEEELSQYIDVDSFVLCYFMTEYPRLTDSYSSSTYFYMDGADDVIHFGPVWDYDCSMGNNANASLADPTLYESSRHVFLRMFLAIPCFADKVNSYYSAYFASGAIDILNIAEECYNEVQLTQKMNYTRWEYALGNSHTTQYTVKNDVCKFCNSYEEGYAKLINWWSVRKQTFKPAYLKSTVTVKQSGSNLIINYTTADSYSKVQAATWTTNGTMDDLKWTTGTKITSDTYQFIVPTSAFNKLGSVTAHIYADGEMVDSGSGILSSKTGKPNSITCTEVNGLQTKFEITARGYYAETGKLSMAVWSVQNNQDDLKWYTMTTTASGTTYKSSATVNIASHKTLGTYYADLYDNGTFIGRKTFTVNPIVSDSVTVTDNQDGTITASVHVTSKSGIRNVTFPVWTTANNQDDLVWYNGSLMSDGTYAVTFSLKDHNYETGTYNVHCYATDGNGIQQYAGAQQISIINSYKNIITANAINGGEKITIRNISSIKNVVSVQVAVWGNINGQNDIVWLTQSYSQSSDSATVKWYPANAKAETGTYNVHVYAKNKSGKQVYVGNTTFTRTNSATGTLSISALSSTKYQVKLSCLSSTFKTAAIYFPTWSDVNGQDDIKWHKGVLNSDGTYTATIEKSAHLNSNGTYLVHAYAVDSAGNNVYIGALSFTMP